MVEEKSAAPEPSNAAARIEGEKSLGRGVLAGIVAAVVLGVVWVAVAALTGSKIGFLAWGMGGLCGYAVLKFSGRGTASQATAILISVVGIIISKYFIVYCAYKSIVVKDFGVEAASAVSVFGAETIYVFMENLWTVFGGFEIPFEVLAVVSAWKITERSFC
ncbi:MAG: hypothetical protein OEV59_02740 [Deltaproteobacteria bacterium]|nr:hypothetical protein [Deltaproteobacteria bacterium]